MLGSIRTLPGPQVGAPQGWTAAPHRAGVRPSVSARRPPVVLPAGVAAPTLPGAWNPSSSALQLCPPNLLPGHLAAAFPETHRRCPETCAFTLWERGSATRCWRIWAGQRQSVPAQRVPSPRRVGPGRRLVSTHAALSSSAGAHRPLSLSRVAARRAVGQGTGAERVSVLPSFHWAGAGGQVSISSGRSELCVGVWRLRACTSKPPTTWSLTNRAATSGIGSTPSCWG